ncbi:MAG: helix-turn-helix domain-containing protein [Campylobacterales bacterium]
MISFQEVVERLKDILSQEMGEKKVFDKDVAMALGITPVNFATLKNRDKIPYEEIIEFCLKRAISINWLLGDQPPESVVEPTNRFNYVRFFRDVKASAGGGAWNDESEWEKLWVAPHVEQMLGGAKAIEKIEAIRVVGDSMEPLLSDGAIIFVDRSMTTIGRGGIYVVATPGGLFVKRLLVKVDGFVELISENPLYPPEKLPPNEIEVLGRVVGQVGIL